MPNVNVFKFGFNAAVGTTTETIWARGGAYNWISTATQLNVSSADANDTSAGTGARKVILEGLDNNWDLYSETVTLNGQTIVTTTGLFKRIHRAYLPNDGAGSGGVNAGVIYMYTGTETAGVPDTATQIYTSIEAGDGQTLQTFYTIPRNHRGEVNSLFASSFGNANNYATVSLRVRIDEGPWRVADRFVISRGIVRIPHEKLPVKVSEKTDLEVIAASDASTVDVSSAFDVAVVQD